MISLSVTNQNTFLNVVSDFLYGPEMLNFDLKWLTLIKIQRRCVRVLICMTWSSV